MPLRSMSKKRRATLASERAKPRLSRNIGQRKPLPKRGKRAWTPSEPAGVGICIYRGSGKGWKCSASERPGPLTWDHALQRSLNPGAGRDDPRLLVRACGVCNQQRGAGYKPPWLALPKVTRDLILELKSEVYARRYFSWLD